MYPNSIWMFHAYGKLVRKWWAQLCIVKTFSYTFSVRFVGTYLRVAMHFHGVLHVGFALS